MTGTRFKLDFLRFAAITSLVAISYYVTGYFSLYFAGPSGYGSAIWPASGVALAVLLAYGYQYWPGVFIGAVAINIVPAFDIHDPDTFIHSLQLGIGIGAGATLQSLVGTFLVRHFVAMPNPLEQPRDIGLIVFLGGPVSCVINSIIGVGVLTVSGALSYADFFHNTLIWWIGDSIGVIVFTPVLLLLFTPRLSVSTTRKILVTLFLCATFSIAIYVFMSSLEAEKRRQQALFDQESSYIAQELNQQLHSYFYILFSIDRLYASSDFVSENEFQTFVKGLFKEYPGLNAVTWRKKVLKHERAAFEEELKNKGYAHHLITERNLDTGERLVLDERNVYFPTTYAEYPDDRPKILGGDSYTHPIRKAALDKARDMGESVMTDMITIFDKNDQKADASVIYHPIYKTDRPHETIEERRESLLGYVAVSFVFSEMLDHIKKQADQTGLAIRLNDKNAEAGRQILYSSLNGNFSKAKSESNFLNYESPISFGGQDWSLEIIPTEDYLAKRHSWSVWLVLAGGLLFTGLFGIFLLLVTGRTDIVKRLVDKKTEQLRLQEQALEEINRLNNAVLSSASYLIVATDTDGKIIVFNREAEKALGYSAQEVLYKKTPEIWHDKKEVIARAEQLTHDMGLQVTPGFDVFVTMPVLRGQERREWTFIRKDGSSFPGDMTVTPLLDNEDRPVGFLEIMQDITERKKIERIKSEFVSTVSHELRTPLTSIRGSLSLIASGMLGTLPEKAASMVNIAHKNSERLVHIINDILDMEKIESGKMQMNIQAVPVEDFLRQAVEGNAAYGDKFNVKYVLQNLAAEAVVLADPDRLMQVMSNLLSNAAKFSPQGGEVNVRAYKLGGKVRFEIQDHGIGIPEEFRGRIFEKFAQADSSSTRKFEGTGLGLSITRQFVELMKGHIGFDTATGKGTTFFFELPQAHRETDEKEISPGRILICEHDREVTEFMRSVLDNAGFESDVAVNIEEAREKIKNNNYAAITLDLIMPDVNGADLLRELRADAATYNLPVLVVSARTDETKRMINGDALGVVDWLTKPVDHVKLVRTLRHSIQHRYEKMPHILHVEDDQDLTKILAEALNGRARLISAPTLKDAYKKLHSQRLDLLIVDLGMPDGSGLELLEHVRENLDYSIPVLILSASETTQDVQNQVAHALVKSRMSEEKIVETIMSLLHHPSPKQENTP